VRGGLIVRESEPPAAPKPRLLDRVRGVIRAHHYSRRTEEAYVAWARRYILFHDKRHQSEMGEGRFHTDPGAERPLFMCAVLELEVPWLRGLVHARRPERLPVVLTRDEVRAVLGEAHAQWPEAPRRIGRRHAAAARITIRAVGRRGPDRRSRVMCAPAEQRRTDTLGGRCSGRRGPRFTDRLRAPSRGPPKGASGVRPSGIWLDLPAPGTRRPRPVRGGLPMIRSGTAEKLVTALQRDGGRVLRFPCLAGETGSTIYEAHTAVRELILNGRALASPNVACSACHRLHLVVGLRTGG